MHKNRAAAPDRDATSSETTELIQRCKCCNSLLQPPVLSHRPTPFILLHGPWLREMGMDVGARVIVEAGLGVVTVALIGPRDRVEAITPNGPDGVIRQIHFTDVHADPIQQMRPAA